MVTSGLLISTALLIGGPALLATAIALSVVLLVRALYVATGRPPIDPQQWRQHWQRRRDNGEDWSTGPIPTMTDERTRQYERTGR
ncbi:hypothetical protein MOQ72_34130 [Saccharopolyspora sp. K220]|uniref:hypothetical protein n=1 Tax=Saccharopolyspora soli TaxID=2926618 RepID=UPI001F57688B|nr:hypothetical protein [Saccharopolyspora soli]MCI2422478.1 hypothetical protein [Saccharopolyspora soli]